MTLTDKTFQIWPNLGAPKQDGGQFFLRWESNQGILLNDPTKKTNETLAYNIINVEEQFIQFLRY